MIFRYPAIQPPSLAFCLGAPEPGRAAAKRLAHRWALLELPSPEHCSIPSGPGRNCPGLPSRSAAVSPPEVAAGSSRIARRERTATTRCPCTPGTQQTSTQGPEVLFGFLRNFFPLLGKSGLFCCSSPPSMCCPPSALGRGRKQRASLEGRPGPLLFLRRNLDGLLCAAALSGLCKDDLLEPLADGTIHPHHQAQAQEEEEAADHKAHRFKEEPAGAKRRSTG